MLAPLLVIWPMSLALTWLAAQGIASRPYDRALLESVRTLSQRIEAGDHGVRFDLPKETARLFRADEADIVYYQVLGTRGEFVSGDRELPVPSDNDPAVPGEPRMRDDELQGDAVRIAYEWVLVPGASHPALVQVGETLSKRSRLATEIIKGVILPQFVILPVAVLLVWFALVRGLAPLNALQRRIRERPSDDLSPIDVHEVPEEVSPLVQAINDLLARQQGSMSTQKRFLADAAHQLKTPLAGLRMQAELAAREVAAGTGDTRSLQSSLQQMAHASQRAAHMVNQLLSMARADAQAVQATRAVVDLEALAIDVVRDFVPKALDQGIDLGYEGPEASIRPDPSLEPAPSPEAPHLGLASASDQPGVDRHAADAPVSTDFGDLSQDGAVADVPADPADPRLDCRVVGHALLLRELLANLVDNALQYTPAGGTVTVRLLSDPFGQVVVLQVEDSGPGIPPAEQELVFQPFYRALGTPVDGSGLGLAIVAEIATQHGSRIALEDARSPQQTPPGEGPGARFTLRLPRAMAA
ncbi:MAG: sensor histidine kinase [Leptothrix sp. (in: b-proteobacteria)]